MKLWVITKKCEKKKGNTNIKQIVFPFGRAETEGFEPSCRDEPTNAFRVRRVMATSLYLHISDTKNINYCSIHEKSCFDQ